MIWSRHIAAKFWNICGCCRSCRRFIASATSRLWKVTNIIIIVIIIYINKMMSTAGSIGRRSGSVPLKNPKHTTKFFTSRSFMLLVCRKVMIVDAVNMLLLLLVTCWEWNLSHIIMMAVTVVVARFEMELLLMGVGNIFYRFVRRRLNVIALFLWIVLKKVVEIIKSSICTWEFQPHSLVGLSH